MPKRLTKIDPLDIDELFRSPSLEGMLSFRDVDPATAALRLKAKTALDEHPRPTPVTPLAIAPTALAPIGTEAIGVPVLPASAEPPPRSSVTPQGFTPIGLAPIGPTQEAPPEADLAVDGPVDGDAISSAEILAEVQDASRVSRSRGRIIRALKVEDAHSGNENSLYWYLWRSGRQIRNSKSRFLQMGYALISKGVGLDRTNVQNILRALETKLALRVVTPGTVKSSTVYEIFSCEQILALRREAGLLWVQRYGSRRVDFVDDNGNLLPPVGLTPIGTIPGPGVKPTPPVGVTPAQPVGATPTQLVSKQTNQQTSSSAPLLQALSQYGPADDEVAQKLRDSCSSQAPDCSEAEIIHFIHQKAALIRSGRISSPIGFLLTAVPKCFAGEAFTLYREEERKRQDLERNRRDRQEAKIQQWRREQEQVLADPNASEDDKRFARQILETE